MTAPPQEKGKPRALVTGASRGIGLAILQRLRAEQWSVVGNARNEANLIEAISGYGAHPVAGDLSQPTGPARIASQTLAHLGGLDALIISSGTYLTGTLQDLDPAQYQPMMQANVFGPLELVRALLPALIAAKGDIVFINSTITSASNLANRAHLAAGNQALKALADGLRDEVNDHGVRVTSVYPGTTATPRTEHLFANVGRTFTAEQLLQPSDVADVVWAALTLAPTAEMLNVYVRPRLKS